MRAAFLLVIRRDLQVALRRKGDLLNVLVFFVIVASLFPLGVGPEPNQLRAMAPGVVWVAALLAALLSLPRLFAADHLDGTLEQMLIAARPLPAVVLGKIASHWIVAGLPLALLAPVLGLQYDLPARALGVLAFSVLIGTPVLSLIGAVGAALTLGLRGAGVLVGLLVLPLYIPVLIFGAGAVSASLAGLDPAPHLSLLGAFLAVSSFVGPWAACAALRVSLD
ncbi:MAG: heme exporter protein CcmB [Betaproteobacteria bacterium]|nr:heme exporter protein CcmB [Betaproteobacteria bacterium]